MFSIKIKNLEGLVRGLERFPINLKREFGRAMRKSMAVLERKTKPLIPVDTGHLRKTTVPDYIRPFKSVFSTHTDYAIYVHENLQAYHRVGEAKFMEKGAKKSEKIIEGLFDKAVEDALMKSIY